MYTYQYPRPAVTVDIAIFMPVDSLFKILLIQRGSEPFKGAYALPGGFVDIQETLVEAAQRELKEETGLIVSGLTQVHTFSDPERDPRGRVISTCFAAILIESDQIDLRAGDDAADAGWFSLEELPPLAFDHVQVIQTVIQEYLHREIR